MGLNHESLRKPLAGPFGMQINKFSDQSKGKDPNKNGLEPSANPEPAGNSLFVNGYNGNFAQNMQFNERGIERVLKIAHLDGQVFLTNLSSANRRSVDANPDGSITNRISLPFGKRIRDDDRQNPLHRVIPTPEGWRIEINDTGIRERLEGDLTGKKLQTEFIKRFNGQFKQGLLECILREKLSKVKDPMFSRRVIDSIAWGYLQIFDSSLFIYNALSENIGGFYGALNSLGIFLAFGIPALRNGGILGRIWGPDDNPIRKNVDHPLEAFMPSVELDKVARAWAFLAGKGRTLVKETMPEAK